MQKYHDEPKQYKGYLKSALERHTTAYTWTTWRPSRSSPTWVAIEREVAALRVRGAGDAG